MQKKPPKHKGIQFSEAELQKVRAYSAKAMEHIEQIATLTFEKLGLKELGPGLRGVGKIIIFPNNTKKIFYDKKTGKCAAVYEDPPGICRPCNDPDSTDGNAE